MNIRELVGLLIEWQEARSPSDPPLCDLSKRYLAIEKAEKRHENAEDALVKFVAENFEDLEQLQ